MQTFLVKPAQLDSRRLNKQSVECYQISNVLLQKLGILPIKTKTDKYGKVKQVKAWHNHPAVLMWEGLEWPFRFYWQEIIMECERRRINTEKLSKHWLTFGDHLRRAKGLGTKGATFCNDSATIFTHQNNLYFKAPDLYPQYKYTLDFSQKRLPYLWWHNGRVDNPSLHTAITFYLKTNNVNLS